MDAFGGVWLAQPLVALAFGLGVFALVGYAHAGVAAQAQRAVLADELIAAVQLAARVAPAGSGSGSRRRGPRSAAARSSAAGRPYTAARRHARRRVAA